MYIYKNTTRTNAISSGIPFLTHLGRLHWRPRLVGDTRASTALTTMPHLYAFVLSSFSFLIYLTWKGTVNSGSSQLNHGSFACMVLAKEVELLKSGKCGKSPILWWLRLAHSIGINGKRSHVPRELLSGELWEAATLNPTRSRPTLTYIMAWHTPPPVLPPLESYLFLAYFGNKAFEQNKVEINME